MAADEDYKPSVDETEGRDTSRLDKDALSQKLKNWYKQDIQHVLEWRKEAREDFDFYSGNQWSEEDTNALRQQNRPAMTFNRVAPLVNAVVGSEINNRREVRYIPREMGDAEANELLTSAAEWFRDQAGAEDEDSDAFEDSVICGMGWTDTRLDFELDPDGAPVVKRMDPLKMAWDCNAVKTNLEDACRLWFIDEKPYSEVREMFPDVEPELLHAGWAKTLAMDPAGPHDQTQADFYTGDQNEFAEQYNNKLCTLVECRWLERETYYRGPDLSSGQIREYTKEQVKLLERNVPGFRSVKQTRKVVKRAFIGRDLLAEPDQPAVPPGMFGWECVTGYRDKLKKQFYGVVRPTKDPQRWANKFFSQVMYLLNSQSKGGIIAERGAFEDDRQAEESWAKADSITWAKNGGTTRIQPKPVAQFPTGFFALFNESKEAISQVTGLSPEFIGTREVDQAGVLEAQRRQSSLNLLASLFNSLRRYRKRQGKVMLYLIQNYLSDGRLIRIVGEDKQEYVPLTRDAIASSEYDIIVDDAPTSPNEKERTFGVLQQMLPLLKDFMTPEIGLQILKYSPLPATLVDQWMKKYQQAQEEAAKNPPPPSPEELKAQAEVQKHEMNMQSKAVDIQTKQQSAQIKERSDAIDLMVQQRKAELDLAVASQKAEIEMQKAAVNAVSNSIRQQNANTARGKAGN
ncbi:phage portal protein [Ochrobactrum sp. 695/2009]|nr:phage portal protein [Ochrobactrum sp. 721/2009]PJT16733.1 phage portal protein [Ochrobactrum sp. 720/2009]PJT26555.1 phage portal protein [Ochrobactrum sp. 715/2009]PJT28629.1 phage portal protein [Ochrobactrum sp. 695/2009]PJT36075.1 phage portal protein [Ochrobactrum sp. 689/2009]